MSRKSLYLSAASLKGKTRGTSRGETPDKRSLEDDFDMNDSDIALMKAAFQILDTNETGVINKTDLISVLDILKTDCQIGTRMLQDLTTLDEEITLDVFIRHLQNTRGNKNTKEGVKKVFKLIDNGEGKVTVESLKNMCKELGENVSDEQIMGVLEKIDPDNKCISSEEFIALMRQTKNR
ncbi:hypothetical protein SteCoe_13848 [Stentor coeruleus]|uniref:EF-hand domain-containing protein n=1 Tax=Stentor coeruleus TaxID=5963 RepID=A0A1R2C7J9_9CILI|nr:hypothetical protein SteCoe_13848 [Stentor coeruleus]